MPGLLTPRASAQTEAQVAQEYNYARFGTRHLRENLEFTLRSAGVQPGLEAPDFELPRADGSGAVRLSGFRGKPVLLRFVSYT
jgi:hypothetical protein